MAFTADVISALQSMLVDVVVPVVVTEVEELDVLLVLELTLVTSVPVSSRGEPGRPHAGPA
ncbi:hypothetical protein [Bradyrhizobium sp. WSM3983]|uniref:hypothetical protein n=1 Tax=Bradyrhizobium sp. WSM3983 TaxID=1038867 RepID=UPI001FD96FFE|nr:hypothetical protein [Bradyrhizobium sp. WSM3983]